VKGGEKLQKKSIPVDSRKVNENEPSSVEFEKAGADVKKIRSKVLTDPLGRNAYDRARIEIGRHQSSLAQVRKLRSLAQATVAELMDMDQSEISRLEHRTDLLLSTLRKYIQATGGELQLVAHFPDGDVELLVGEDLFEVLP
jgi:hypothetical protein